jgi:UDP-N-acetylglucosamine acyltransferase
LRGLKRRGFSEAVIRGLKDAYKAVYRSGLTVDQALQELAPISAQHPEVAVFTNFIRNAERGIIR